MSEPELPGIPPPPELPKLQWYRRLLARWKWPGWASIGLGGSRIFHLWEDLDFAFNALRSLGGEIGMIAAVITSPFFAIGLIAYGVVHLVVVGEPRRPLQHQAWVYLGWSIFGVCLTAIIMTAGWGVIQAYIQSQIYHGIETQKLPDRHLLSEQINNLLGVLKPNADSFPNNMQVESVSSSPDAAGYAQQFMEVFHLAGLTVNGIKPDDNKTMLFPSPAQVSSSQIKGVFIGASGIPPPSPAVRFQAVLKEAGFNAPFIRWSGIGADDFVFVVACQ
jgi:hypothetical protein